MRQNEVIVYYAPWKGERQVDQEDACALAVTGYEVNGHDLHPSYATLHIGDGFIHVSLEVPDYSDAMWDDYRESNIAHAQERIASVRDELTEEDWLEETTDDVLVLLVARLEMRERVLSKV